MTLREVSFIHQPPYPEAAIHVEQHGGADSGGGVVVAIEMSPQSGRKEWLDVGTVLQCAVAFSLTCAIVFTNLLVLLVRVRDKRLRKQVSSFFIKSLAVSDLCVGLFQSVPGISSVLFLQGTLGYWWVKLSVYGTMTAGAVSMYAIICISLDRYIAVTRPLRYWAIINTKYCKMAIGGAWIASAILMLPTWTPAVPTVYTSTTFAAVLDYARCIPFVVALAYIVYIPAALTLLIVYLQIMKISYGHVQRIQQDRRKFSINPELVTPESVSKRTKFLRNSLFIIITWFLTWIPRGIYITYEIIAGPLPWADFVTLWLTLSNNFTHAMIYNWFHKDFRRALREVFYFCPFYGKKKTYEQLVYSIHSTAVV